MSLISSSSTSSNQSLVPVQANEAKTTSVLSLEQRRSLVLDANGKLNGNLKSLIHSLIVKHYDCPEGDEKYKDMEAKCSLAAWDATKYFDPQRGVKFLTFAFKYMLGALHEANRQFENVLSGPHKNVPKNVIRLDGPVSNYSDDGDPMSIHEVVADPNALDPGEIIDATAFKERLDALAVKYTQNGGWTRTDKMSFLNNVIPLLRWQICSETEAKAVFAILLENFSARDRAIFVQAKGILGHEKMSEKDVARKYGMTTARVCQIVKSCTVTIGKMLRNFAD